MIYNFEGHSLDIDRRELRVADKLVAVEPQIFDLLTFLIRNSDRVVSKDDLISGVWKGRIVSDSTLNSSINAVRQALGDSGDAQRFIRTIPRKGFRFVSTVRQETNIQKSTATPPATEETAPSGTDGVLSLPDKPSIAVLPFLNLSGGIAQDYFVDGIVEDITTALSQFGQLFVVARSSSFTYKGRNIDVKQIGQELGVRYVLEGSIRKAASQVRITVRLINSQSGVQLWSARYDGALKQVFDLQDQVTSGVVGVIAPKIEQAEIARAKRKPTGSLDAYDYYLHGMASIQQDTREANDEALRFFERAVVLLDRSLLLNPNLAISWVRSAWVRIFLGQFDLAIEHASRAMRLSPLDPFLVGMQTAIAFAHFCAGRHEQSAAWAIRAVKEQPTFGAGLRVLAASSASLGKMDEATKALARLRETGAPMHLSEMWHFPFRKPKHFAKYADALRKAGFAE